MAIATRPSDRGFYQVLSLYVIGRWRKHLCSFPASINVRKSRERAQKHFPSERRPSRNCGTCWQSRSKIPPCPQCDARTAAARRTRASAPFAVVLRSLRRGPRTPLICASTNPMNGDPPVTDEPLWHMVPAMARNIPLRRPDSAARGYGELSSPLNEVHSAVASGT